MKLKAHTIYYRLGTVGDFVTNDMTPDETAQFWRDHNEYVNKLKREGTYGKEVALTVLIEEDEFMDGPSEIRENPVESYRIDILDMRSQK